MIKQVLPEAFGVLPESFCDYKDSYIQLGITM